MRKKKRLGQTESEFPHRAAKISGEKKRRIAINWRTTKSKKREYLQRKQWRSSKSQSEEKRERERKKASICRLEEEKPFKETSLRRHQDTILFFCRRDYERRHEFIISLTWYQARLERGIGLFRNGTRCCGRVGRTGTKTLFEPGSFGIFIFDKWGAFQYI